jgi:hypothetical protein
MIVNRDRVVTHNEFDFRVFGRDNLTDAPCPDRGVHHADALHFAHELVLRQRWVLRPQPVETFGSADFLDVDVLEQSLEMMHPLFDVRANIGADGGRSSGIDVAKKPAFDLVVD